MNDQDDTEGARLIARLMADAAQKAAEAAHGLIFECINTSGLSDHRKIGAAITAVFQLMGAFWRPLAKREAVRSMSYAPACSRR